MSHGDEKTRRISLLSGKILCQEPPWQGGGIGAVYTYAPHPANTATASSSRKRFPLEMRGVFDEQSKTGKSS